MESLYRAATERAATADLRLYGAVAAVALTSSYVLGYIIYNLYFHPLSKVPGPLLARASLLWRMWHSMGGRFHAAIDNQHKRYGSVFRVSPNELSFASVNSWKAIYGHALAGKPTLIKSKFYEVYGSGYDSLCIGSERDPKKHGGMRKYLSAAFSTRALIEQEALVQRCVDNFVERIGEVGSKPEGIDMTKWFEMTAFDILGEMAFGESFHSVDAGKPHFWQEIILEHLFFITVVDNLRRYPLLVTLGKWLLPKVTTSIRDKHSGHSRQAVQNRLGLKCSRRDFLSQLVDKVESGEVDKEELTAHSSTLIIAGGETVATFYSAAHYHLLKNPETYQKLKNEIRGRYKSYDEIDASSAQALPYLMAVVHEGLRIYPPGSQGFPRESPGTTVDGVYVPAGCEVYTSAWTVTHDPQYFHDPFKFKPERWIDPNCQDVKEASQPFSLGPRGCLGRNFAYMEIALTLAKMHFKYDLELVNKDLEWEKSSHMHVMWWKPALMVRFTERKVKA